MITWLKLRQGTTLGEFLNCLGTGVEKCDVHFSERGPARMTFKPPFPEPDPGAAPYLDTPCSGFCFGFDSGTGSMVAYVLLAPRSVAPAPVDVPMD